MAQLTEEDLAGLRATMQMPQEQNAGQQAQMQTLQAEGQARMQQMQAQLDQQQAAGTDLLQQLNGARKTVEEAGARRSTAEQQLAEERSRAMQTRPLVDISKLGP